MPGDVARFADQANGSIGDPRGLQSEDSFSFLPSLSSELEDMPEPFHLNQSYLSGDDYAPSYSILRENGATALPAIPKQGPNDGFPPLFIRPSPGSAIFSSNALGPIMRHRSESLPSAHRGPPVLDARGTSLNPHRPLAQFRCDECGQTFTALFSLKRHAQSHTGERPFLCGIPGCTQRFFNSSDCRRHERSKKRHVNLVMQ